MVSCCLSSPSCLKKDIRQHCVISMFSRITSDKHVPLENCASTVCRAQVLVSAELFFERLVVEKKRIRFHGVILVSARHLGETLGQSRPTATSPKNNSLKLPESSLPPCRVSSKTASLGGCSQCASGSLWTACASDLSAAKHSWHPLLTHLRCSFRFWCYWASRRGGRGPACRHVATGTTTSVA